MTGKKMIPAFLFSVTLCISFKLHRLNDARFIDNSILDKIKHVGSYPLASVHFSNFLDRSNKLASKKHTIIFLSFYNTRSFLIWGQVTNIC